MARDRDERGTRYRDEGEYLDDERERRHRRRHRAREYDDRPSVATRERRERRRVDEARREAELDIDDLRARRESYYARPEAERRHDQERMAQEIRRESVKHEPRSTHREVRRDGTRRVKRREVVADDRSDDYVYGRPKSRGHVEEVTVRRSSARKRSDEGGSSNRTAYTPLSGSGSASVRRVEVPALTRSDLSPLIHVALTNKGTGVHRYVNQAERMHRQGRLCDARALSSCLLLPHRLQEHNL
jgi:hypothetical protein